VVSRLLAKESIARKCQADALTVSGIIVDHIALDALKQRNVRLGYTPSALTDAVADLTVMLTLMAQRLGGEVSIINDRSSLQFTADMLVGHAKGHGWRLAKDAVVASASLWTPDNGQHSRLPGFRTHSAGNFVSLAALSNISSAIPGISTWTTS
jgi:hypothetical protein